MNRYPQILCLGEILFDYLADQLGATLDDVASWTAYPGGAPANVACALVKLGTPTAFMGCIGSDAPGDQLVSLLEKIGVNITGIQRHPTAPTRQVYVTRSLAGERYFASFGNKKTNEFADTKLSAEKLSDSLFIHANYLVIGTLELAYPESQQAIRKALQMAKKHQIKVFVDINWRPVFWHHLETAKPLITEVLHQADFIKCSDEEAQWLFNTKNPQKIAQNLQNVEGILVTAGEKGCYYYLGKHLGKIDAFTVNVVDTTGAGDSFVAGFLHQCCLGDDRLLSDPEMAKKAVTYANAVGALTTTKPGAIAAQPTQEEVRLFLTQN